MASSDATLTGYVPHVSLPCRHTITIAPTNFDQKHSCSCSVSSHRTLTYGQDCPLSDVATSAACMGATFSLQNAHGTVSAESHLHRDMSGPFHRTPGHRC
ncbi:hypothetical protein AVEN_244208-1 [Araneus ventricosus]|uniref:Uncharacterized protein n=1 Tax=Araneus ventricosus TaxID=182803 RepID=A0A4Y2JWC8_ARAVE|nr:hypothetical protein AVEN_244208-1 [Araneus ventricosus]